MNTEDVLALVLTLGWLASVAVYWAIDARARKRLRNLTAEAEKDAEQTEKICRAVRAKHRKEMSELCRANDRQMEVATGFDPHWLDDLIAELESIDDDEVTQ